GLPITLALFFIFPKSQNLRIGSPFGKGTMGFSENMNPGSVSEISESQELVFRLFGIPENVDPDFLYFRGAVLTASDGLAWKKGKIKHE
ncbi:DUF3488 domain-containing protein, partial [Streptomyces galilaeus]